MLRTREGGTAERLLRKARQTNKDLDKTDRRRVCILRWCVEAAFADGAREILRDFRHQYEASAFASRLQGQNLYPGRPYRLEVRECEAQAEEG